MANLSLTLVRALGQVNLVAAAASTLDTAPDTDNDFMPDFDDYISFS